MTGFSESVLAKPFEIDENTQASQNTASDPSRSAWVSANAGSGKTYVLTRRVVRLLLSGTDPSRILCLTFTRTAAAEMSNKVFDTLSEWALMRDNELAAVLQKISGNPPDEEQIKQARRLFARALETPGGLKIQTIHAFCEALLQQFPLEANIAGHFEILDGPTKKTLIGEAQRRVVMAAQAGENQTLGQAFRHMLAVASDYTIGKTLQESIAKRNRISAWLRRYGGVEAAVAAIRQQLNIGPHETPETVITDAPWLLSNAEMMQLADAAEVTGVSRNIAFSELMRQLATVDSAKKRYRVCAEKFLTTEGKLRKVGGFFSVTLAKQLPDLCEKFEQELAQFGATRDRISLLAQVQDSQALVHMADAINTTYQQLKEQRGLLDFDDLVVKSAELLDHSDARLWVQYKLDQGIDHVLVDEAQDTNRDQWRVISALIDDFFAGEGAERAARSVFAVGDEKQSIYSFQGAEPDAFAHQRDRLAARAKAASSAFSKVRLRLSFRSTKDILSAVDQVFSIEENYAGLSRDREPTFHDSIRGKQPGMVDIWPLIEKQPTSEPQDWAEPVDALAANDPQILLAANIADAISRMLNENRSSRGGDKPVRAGDILVLVRSRDRFSTALTRALKQRNVPVAGSDRLLLTDHIAVQDLLSLGRVVLLPDDDLALAALLKSPLFAFDEDDLFDLAHNRGVISLYQVLEQRAKTNDKAETAWRQLEILRQRADQMPVYEFYALLLGADGGRRVILSRLGAEAEDVLDAFLAQTLEHEKSGHPGLEGFIAWLQSSSLEIKREFDLTVDEVKIMTVHAAKGLEAPVVFVVDKGAAPYHGRHDPSLVELDASGQEGENSNSAGFLWIADKRKIPEIARQRLDIVKTKAEQEYKRLLYVAMTRAADRLIVCGTAPLRGPHADCWHSVVLRALQDQSTERCDADDGDPYLRWQQAGQTATDRKDFEAKPEAEPVQPLPDWVDRKLTAEPVLPRPLTPSGAQALIERRDARANGLPPRDGNQKIATAMARGIAVHRLMQTLPDIDCADDAALARREAALGYLTITGWNMTQATEIMKQVFSVLEDRRFSQLFLPGRSRAEVPIAGTVELRHGPRLVCGQIDRLVVENDRVTIIDYKTSRQPPPAPDAVDENNLSQLALYHRLVKRIYPHHRVEAALLWTEIPSLMPVPTGLIEQQFSKIAQA